ncbi:hypothetical protein [Glutamicibacter arilaitensis]|uniref:hypothetical protein n=1 Tax=Glutamicibacter arilaitensis TaxID=256701 RepID=UPI003F8EA033
MVVQQGVGSAADMFCLMACRSYGVNKGVGDGLVVFDDQKLHGIILGVRIRDKCPEVTA